MKKTLLHCGALLLALSFVGCEPPAMKSTEESVTLPATLPADSNVTATAETPAIAETPTTSGMPPAPVETAPAPVEPVETAPAPVETAPAEKSAE